MAVNKNGGYIESIDPSKLNEYNKGVVDDVIRKASALQTDSRQTAAFEESEVKTAQGVEQQEKHKAAGAEHASKVECGNAEGQVATEALSNLAPSAALAANLYDGLKECNPSNAHDVTQAKSSGFVSAGAESYNDSFSRMKGSINTGPWQSGFTRAEETSEFFGSSDITTQFISDISASSRMATALIKSTVLNTQLADAAKLGQALELKRQMAPQAPGLGGGSMRGPMLAYAPKPPDENILKEGNTEGALA